MVRLKGTGYARADRCATRISIPVWCDWRCQMQGRTLSTSTISIPVWCDWRPILTLWVWPYPIVFQFQYGAIEGHLIVTRDNLNDVISIPVWCDWREVWQRHGSLHFIFQFQYGAIEGYRLTGWSTSSRNFNSSMVRLKGCWRCDNSLRADISIPVWCDWRSLMMAFDNDLYKFQFQYGAIEGGIACHDMKFDLNFNSSMVRLKENGFETGFSIGGISIPVWCDWRSSELSRARDQYRDFNSSMVRLKEQDRFAVFVVSDVISIPVWCDWRPVVVGVYGICNRFQFQYGAIEGNMNDVDDLLMLISIPVWCDWRWRAGC